MEEAAKTDEETAELLEEKYSDICADLVTSRGHEEFLRCLGSQKSGTWVEAASLTDGSSESSRRLRTLEAQKDYRLHIRWTEHPDAGTDYCVIIFFLYSTLWSYRVITRKENLHL